MQSLSQTMHLFLTCLLLLRFLIVTGYGGTPTPAASIKSASGFRLRLIHRDSIYSPSYPGNLTDYELIQRRVNYAKAHIQHIHDRHDHVAPTDLTPIVEHGGNEYMVQLYIGSNQVFQYLMVDTGSDLIWVQCEPYQGPHFDQVPPHYVIGNSTTLSYAPCSDRNICLDTYTCDDTKQQCLVKEAYHDGSRIKGVLSKERFNFENDMGNTTAFDNIIFGCMYTTMEHMFTSTNTAGILGLGRGHQSLATQLAAVPDLGMYQFMHCFVPLNVTVATFLKFGQDFAIPGPIQTLKFINNPKEYTFYYLNLTGITCNTDRLNISESTFAIGRDGSGGTVIDSGSSVTHLVQPAYNTLTAYLEDYFEKDFKYRRVAGPLSFCYALMDGPPLPLPTMIYHFGEEGNWTVDVDRMWINLTIGILPTNCLGILPDTTSTTIGANHQTNMRFVYDLHEATLSFGYEDCRNDD